MPSLIDRYRDRLPVTADTPVVSLGEGSTPLLRAPRISRRLGVELYLKWEGANPTGSFKDRGMTVAISKALEAGAGPVVCASTGNTAASAAAYAARAGIVAVVLQPEGAVSSGKLAQAQALGARVLEVRGSFESYKDVVRATLLQQRKNETMEAWVEDLTEQCGLFPKGEHDDDVDALTQALVYLQKRPVSQLTAGQILAIGADDRNDDDDDGGDGGSCAGGRNQFGGWGPRRRRQF